MLSVYKGNMLGWGIDSAGGWVLVLCQWLPILMKSLKDLLTFSKCLGRLTSEVQSTYNTEHCWKQKI